MAPTLHLLPQSQLELRPIHGEHAQRELKWLLRSRDARARPLWEVVLATPALHGLLERLGEGHAEAYVDSLHFKVYPDRDLEAGISSWACQQLACHSLVFSQPSIAGVTRIEGRLGASAQLS